MRGFTIVHTATIYPNALTNPHAVWTRTARRLEDMGLFAMVCGTVMADWSHAIYVVDKAEEDA